MAGTVGTVIAQKALIGWAGNVSNETISGTWTFTADPSVPDEAYGVSWNGSLEVPTKNAVYDKIQALAQEVGLNPFLLMGG